MSRLSAFSVKFIEACWLAAIIMAPLFFNVYSSRVFEPDKISLVRTLALLMLAAWLVLRAETIRNARGRDEEPLSLGTRVRQTVSEWSRSNPLTLPTLGLIAIYLISTVTSVSPSVSLLGSYQRLEGLYTTLSYIVIFFLAASTIRTQSQIDRAITVALVVSFPIAFYGIIQHYFLDPLPWGGDVTARVSSNMGNSIFVGAYLIMVVPLALGRLLDHSRRAASEISVQPYRWGLYTAIGLSFLLIVAAWGLSFELGAKDLIESNYTGTLTPEMLAATESAFALGLAVTFVVALGWWAAGALLKKRAGTYLLIGLYTLLLAVQGLTLIFTQSRGPELGLFGGLFAFVLLYSLVRGRRLVAFVLVGVTLFGILFLALFNFSSLPPFPALRDAPYIGRLGRVFQTDDGTGKVRVLIWQGALQLVLPHAPLWSPTTGSDNLNPLRPLIGYGPESMYVAFNPFYPPDLGKLESRNATSDRSHNETFDALVTTGLIGFIAENLLFLAVFFFGLKWLGFINSARERNTFIALWYVGGIVAALLFGANLGWQFIGVALPAGMIVGLFIYLVGFAILRGGEVQLTQDPARALLLIMFLSAIVSHFVEIHFGIAIVSTRTYFWFLAALLVVVGVGPLNPVAAEMVRETPRLKNEALPTPTTRKHRARRVSNQPAVDTRRGITPRVLSTAPLLAFAFLGGLILATMGFDFINPVNAGQGATAADVIIASLFAKSTTAGVQNSYTMLWLFVGTLLMLLGLGVAEWGREARLQLRDWLFAVGISAALAAAIFVAFAFYHTNLIDNPGGSTLDTLTASVALFVVFMIVMTIVVAVTLLLDVALPQIPVLRPTNWIVAPGLALLAIILLNATNISIVQADMIYKQASNLTDPSSLPTAITLYQQTLEMQPTQDYYYLFLGRSYLDYAQTQNDPAARLKSLTSAEQSLLTARSINPLNTDHSANLARLEQAWASLITDPAAQEQHYKQALAYFGDAIHLSPHTAHLYDQYAQVQLDYARFLTQQHREADSAQATLAAQGLISNSLQIDSTFCLTYSVRALAQSDWQAEVSDALESLKLASICGDVFEQDGRSLALQTLSAAGDRATSAHAGAQFASQLENAAQANPSIETYTALTNYYSQAGQIDASLKATDAALALMPAGDQARQRYTTFRQTLLDLQQVSSAANAAPSDPEAQRRLASTWLGRGQTELALAQYQKVLALKPSDYDAARHVTLLLVQRDQLADAARMITPTLSLAPANEQIFWLQLGSVLSAAQDGQTASASSTLDGLIKSVDPKDSVALDALHALSAVLKGQG